MPVDSPGVSDYPASPTISDRAQVGNSEDRVATHKSAKKRARQDLKRRARNRQVKSRVRGAVKTFRVAVEGDDAEKTGEALRTAEGILRRAATKGVIPRKQASRRISRLTKVKNRAL